MKNEVSLIERVIAIALLWFIGIGGLISVLK